MFLSFVKKLFNTTFLLNCPMCIASTKEGLKHLLRREFLMKNQEALQILEHITNISICSYNIKFSVKKTFLYFDFTALCYV